MAYRDKRQKSEYGKAYYAAHRAEILARQIARNATGHAKTINRKAVAKYRAAHKAEAAERAKARREADIDGHRERDRATKARWYAANPQEARDRANAYGTAHAKGRAERAAKWRLANPERVAELSIETRKRRKGAWLAFLERERERYQAAYQIDPGKYSAKSAKRRCARLQATPAWADLAAIVDIYRRAQEITRETGINHDVDHIIPLRGRTVWGLHIPINLQILTSTKNRRKSNKFHVNSPDNQPAIFASPVAGSPNQ
jgi:5-methylcytosine-specific restriction endonuclease McrA